MGLAVTIGTLAGMDDSVADALRRDFEHIDRVLEEHQLPPHAEPEDIPQPTTWSGLDLDRDAISGGWLSSFPYGALHRLRRAVAYARQRPQDFGPMPADGDPLEPELIEEELMYRMDSHLICHSDVEGYYVPIDFDMPLHDMTDQLPGGILGSSRRALDELRATAPLLGIDLHAGELDRATAEQIAAEDHDDPLGLERYVWLVLWVAFTSSLETSSAVRFG